MNSFETNDKNKTEDKVEFGPNSSFSAQAAEQSKNDYEKVLELLREKKLDFGSVSFTSNKETQENERKDIREASDALDAFYEKMQVHIEGLTKYNDAEQKIMSDAQLAYQNAQQAVITTKAKVDELAATPTGGIGNWFKNKVLSNLEARKLEAQKAYDAAVANEIFCKNDIPASEKRAMISLETRRNAMTVEQFNYEFTTRTNAILSTLETRLKASVENRKALTKAGEVLATKLTDLGKENVKLEKEKEDLKVKLSQLNTDLADVGDTTSPEYIKLQNQINTTKVEQADNAGAINAVVAQIGLAQTHAATITAQHQSMTDQFTTIDLHIKQLRLQVTQRLTSNETLIISMKNADVIEVSSTQGATNNMLDRKSTGIVLQNSIESLNTVKKVFIDTKEHGEDMKDMIQKAGTVSRDLVEDIDLYKKEHFSTENKTSNSSQE